MTIITTIVDTTDGKQAICSCNELHTPFVHILPICDKWVAMRPGDRCIHCNHWEACHVGPRRTVHFDPKDNR